MKIIALVKETYRKKLFALKKLKCVSLRTDKRERHGLVPHDSHASPADGHCVEAVLAARGDERPVLADKLEGIVGDVIGCDGFEVAHKQFSPFVSILSIL